MARDPALLPAREPQGLLEPDAVKAASPVLRGAGRSNAPGLPVDAKKLAALFRGDLLRFVQPPTPQTEGLRDLLRCRADIRCARTTARQRVAKQLLRHGRVFREGKKAWTMQHRAWVLRQQPEDPLAHEALSQMLTHLDSLDRQLATLDAQLEHVARHDRWAWQVAKLRAFRGIGTPTALGLIAEIGDFARFSHRRELASWLGITPSEYCSGDQQHRGHITKSGNRHAHRLLTEAAWHYRHHPADRPGNRNRALGPGRRRSACSNDTDTSQRKGNARPS